MNMTITEQIIHHVKATPGLTSKCLIELIKDCESINDMSSMLSTMYRDGRLDREAAIINKRHSYRYTFRSDTPIKRPPKTVDKMAKAKMDTIDNVSDSVRKTSRIDIIGQNGNDGEHYDALPPADPALLASANRMLSERLAGVAHALRGSGLPYLAEIDDGEDLQQHVAALTGAYQMALAERDSWRADAEKFSMSANMLRDDFEELQRESIKGMTCSSRQKERVFHGYACMVGGAEIHQDEAAARMDAEAALENMPAGKVVAVVEILAMAENVLAPLWK